MVRDAELNDYFHAESSYAIIDGDGDNWRDFFPHLVNSAEDMVAYREGSAKELVGEPK
jgi:hypothetical protein